MPPLDAQSILIRVLRFEGALLHFVHNDKDPTARESLPLAAQYHQVATKPPPLRLCRASVLNGVIVVLAPTRTMT